MNIDDYRAAVNFSGTVFSTDDNHMDIHLEIICKMFLTPRQRRQQDKWDLARGWLEENWDEYMAKCEDGFLHKPSGKFLTRERTFQDLPPAVKAKIEQSENRTWADASDFYTV